MVSDKLGHLRGSDEAREDDGLLGHARLAQHLDGCHGAAARRQHRVYQQHLLSDDR